MTIALGFASGNSQLFPGPPESLEPDSFPCCPRDQSFFVYCYADDILIRSTSVTGLQELLNIATSYIVSHGLKFNPKKTSCYIMGRNPFTTDPQWFIDSELLKIEDSIPYLGSVLGDPKGKAHCESRIRATTRSYFALQGANIKFPGVDALTSLEL